MSSRYLALARALRAASGASASCSSAGICGGGGGARESIRILCSSGSMTMATMKPSSSSSSSSIWSRELTVSAASQRYLPPVRTGGPSMVDKDAPEHPAPKPELVDRILGVGEENESSESSETSDDDPVLLLPRAAAKKLAARAAAAAAARSEADTGSPEAQVAALSQRIRGLAEHLRLNRQDKGSARGLQAMLARRRRLLRYLRRTDLASYGEALARHSLKDRYSKLDRLGARKAATAAAGGAGGGSGGKKKKK